jgi:hypothetical protein
VVTVYRWHSSPRCLPSTATLVAIAAHQLSLTRDFRQVPSPLFASGRLARRLGQVRAAEPCEARHGSEKTREARRTGCAAGMRKVDLEVGAQRVEEEKVRGHEMECHAQRRVLRLEEMQI